MRIDKKKRAKKTTVKKPDFLIKIPVAAELK